MQRVGTCFVDDMFFTCFSHVFIFSAVRFKVKGFTGRGRKRLPARFTPGHVGSSGPDGPDGSDGPASGSASLNPSLNPSLNRLIFFDFPSFRGFLR